MGLEDRLRRLEDGAPEEQEDCETCRARSPVVIVWDDGSGDEIPDECPDCGAAWEYDDIEVTWGDA